METRATYPSTHPGDHKQIKSVTTAAFGGSAEAGLVEALRRDGDVETSLVAETETHIVGHIVWSKMTALFERSAWHQCPYCPNIKVRRWLKINQSQSRFGQGG